jgi:hypothetical protein
VAKTCAILLLGLVSLILIACGGRSPSTKPTNSAPPAPELAEVEEEKDLFVYTKRDHKSCVQECLGDDPEGLDSERAFDCIESCREQCHADCTVWRRAKTDLPRTGDESLIGYCDSTCDLEWPLQTP